MAQIFAHEEFLGLDFLEDIEGDDENMKLHDSVINNPQESGQMGTVVNMSHKDFSITNKALALLKQMEHGDDEDSLGAVMIYKANDGNIIFAFMGGPRAMTDYTNPANINISRDTDLSLLDELTGNDDTPPEDFIKAVGDYQEQQALGL